MSTASLTLDDLLALEHRGWESLCRSEGGTFYGKLMAPQALMVLVNGMVLDQPTVAETLNESPPWSSYSIAHARLIPTGGTGAALVYTATAVREGQHEPFTALMASHYTLIGGIPTLMLYQQTTVTH